MGTLARVLGLRTASPSRRRRPLSDRVHTESLECRVLPATFFNLGDVDIVGRASDGTWQVSTPTGSGLSHQVFSHWSPSVDWRDVRTGDFDGDGQNDIAGRNPADGFWWLTMADPVGSTVLRGGHWATSTTWSDVAAIDLAAPGDRGEQGHFTHKSDLVGRAGDGSWWAAVSNGDGTFQNVYLTTWNPNAGWRDVRFLDINNDDETDIVGRASDGTWWAAVNRGGLAFENVFLDGWRESAGWRDVRAIDDFFGFGSAAVVARAASGDWWALVFRSDGTIGTVPVGRWNEAAGWQDVLVTPAEGAGPQIVGRTATGEWWALDNTGSSTRLGTWNEAAGWRDVQAFTLVTVIRSSRFETTITSGVLLGRTETGEWWMSIYDPGIGDFRHTRLGSWNEAAGWRDVFVARVTEPPVRSSSAFRPVPQLGVDVGVSVRGHRAGTDVVVEDIVGGEIPGVRITYSIPAIGFTRTFDVFAPVARNSPFPVSFMVSFGGHLAADDFRNDSTQATVVARGWAGDDRLDSENGRDFDALLGGDGLDVLLGDPGDLLTQ